MVMIVCYLHTRLQSKDFVVVLVLVLVPRNPYNSDFEDEKQSTGHFSHLSLMSLHPNCPEGAPFSERGLGKSLGP